MVLENSQQLEGKQMFREAREKWTIIIPEEDLHQSFPGTKVNGTIEKIDKAVAKARRELIAVGENLSALKVSQAFLVVLQVVLWDSLGVQMQQVPSLYRLMLIEGKITTLSDLEPAICNNEGIQQFEELELRPLIRHPLSLWTRMKEKKSRLVNYWILLLKNDQLMARTSFMFVFKGSPGVVVKALPRYISQFLFFFNLSLSLYR